MKRKISIFVLSVLAIGACQQEKLSDKQVLDSRAAEAKDLKVSYAIDGSELNVLSFTSKSGFKTVDVKVNNENLVWSVESNRNWCTVREEAHRGPGSFTVDVVANESFDERESATLTFVAGPFRGFTLEVKQNAAGFIVSQPWFLSPNKGGELQLSVTTPKGVSWESEPASWMTVSKVSESENDEGSVTTLKINVEENSSASRYGKIVLSNEKGEKDEIAVNQFGSELEYNDAGDIFFGNDAPAKLSFIIPEYLISDFVLPEYVKSERVSNGDGTETVTLTLDENLSDCGELREAELSLILSNLSASVVKFPVIKQDYLPAHGIITPKGLQLFAQAVAEGKSTEDWEKDGTVVLLGDIDMKGVSLWTGIGTDENPFKGKFNGNSHSVINLAKAGAGLFHNCDGAAISSVTLGSGSSIYYSGTYEADVSLGGIVDYAKATTIKSCTFAASMEFAGVADDELEARVGGVVGFADADSHVTACKSSGVLRVSSTDDGNTTLYLGGVAGKVLGELKNAESTCEIALTGGVGKVNLGGVMAVLESGASVSGNAFSGSMDLKGNATQLCAGGLYGIIPAGEWSFDFASDKSVISGEIAIGKFASSSGAQGYFGGLVGKLNAGASLTVKGYTIQTKFVLDLVDGPTVQHLCIGGVLGGCDYSSPAAGVSMEGVTNKGTQTVELKTDVAVTVRRACVGGLVGLVNAPSSFSGCENLADLGLKGTGGDYCAKSNGYTMIMGGIAGLCYGGDMSITNCNCQASLYNNIYSNREAGNLNGDNYTSLVTGSILGAFNYKSPAQNFTVTVSDCTAKATLVGYRGFLGGIAGYAYGAKISNCNWDGKSEWNASKTSNQASYKGGIVGGFGKGSVENCTAKGNLFTVQAGSAKSADGGGVIGHVMDNEAVSVSGCSYFGNLDSHVTSGTLISYLGGIVGLSTANTTVSKCKFGGNYKSVPVSENNLEATVFGNNLGTATELSYWNGN